MNDENSCTNKFSQQPPDCWQKIAADDVNRMDLCQLNLQVMFSRAMLPSTVRPHRTPMFKIWNLPRRPLTLLETLPSSRGVQRKKQPPRIRRRVQFKKRMLEIMTGELNAEFDRLFSGTGSRSSHATKNDDIEDLSYKASQMNITTLE